jgi:uncharacterized protein (DUF1778 family)
MAKAQTKQLVVCIAGHETLELSDRDREAFFAALINPSEPSERLVRALAAHKQRVVS